MRQRSVFGLMLSLLVFTVHFFTACSREEVDMVKPEIHFDFSGASPIACDTLFFGEVFHFRMNFSDDVELGAFNLDIHHNFDHHSHTTEGIPCPLDPKKPPVNPWVFIQDYPIPSGLKFYEADMEWVLPSGNDAGPYDEGDYHLVVRVTDRSGWSAYKSFGIKILHAR